VTSGAFTVGAAAPAKLTFANLPTDPVGLDTVIGKPVQVQVRDAAGNLLTDDNTTRVTLTLVNGIDSGGWLAGTPPHAARAGLPTSPDLVFKGTAIASSDTPGVVATSSKTLQATFDDSSITTPFQSAAIRVKHGPAVGLSIPKPDETMPDFTAGDPMKT